MHISGCHTSQDVTGPHKVSVYVATPIDCMVYDKELNRDGHPEFGLVPDDSRQSRFLPPSHSITLSTTWTSSLIRKLEGILEISPRYFGG